MAPPKYYPTKNGRFNLYSDNIHVDLAEQSEDHLTKVYAERIKARIIPPTPPEEIVDAEEGEVAFQTTPEVTLIEGLIEKLVLNGEERVKRTYEAVVDPNHGRFLNAADECFDQDRVTTTKINFTNNHNLQVNNHLGKP